MAVDNHGSMGQTQDGRSRFTRLTAGWFPQRPGARKVPPFDLQSTVELVREYQLPNSTQTLSAQDTRPSIGNNGQAGEVGGAPTFSALNSSARMSIRQLMTWTQLGGRLELRREIPRGMAIDLILKGRKSELRLARGSRPKDEVLRGI
jgi:hypothetical protein